MNTILIASPIVAVCGMHPGFFDVFEIEPDVYLAIPRNKWEVEHTPTEYDEFYFTKLQNKWVSEPAVFSEILNQVVLECGFK